MFLLLVHFAFTLFFGIQSAIILIILNIVVEQQYVSCPEFFTFTVTVVLISHSCGHLHWNTNNLIWVRVCHYESVTCKNMCHPASVKLKWKRSTLRTVCMLIFVYIFTWVLRVPTPHFQKRLMFTGSSDTSKYDTFNYTFNDFWNSSLNLPYLDGKMLHLKCIIVSL